MKKWRMASWTLILVLALGVPTAWAQQKDPRLNPPVAPLPPISPGESSSKSALDDPVPNPQNAVKPDESPLSGAEAFTLGTSGGGRSYVTPTIRYTQIADYSKKTTGTLDDWRSTGTLVGQLALQRIWGRSQMGIDYSGGGTLFTTASNSKGSFHRLGINQQISWRRVTLMLADSMIYLPDSSFGAGGIGGIGLGSGMTGGLGNGGIGTGLGGGGFGGGLGGGLIPGITPNQSILTGSGRRISNTALGQIQYTIGPRSSVTASGSYGMLRFLDSGFISSNNYQFMTGYNYKMNSADTIGLVYSLSMLRFGGITRSANFHSFHFAYGRRLTGRLALRLSGGPQFGTFANQVAGSSNRVSWSLRSSLSYNFRNTDLGLNYSHGATTGSGVMVGSDTDRVDGSIRRQLTRMWQGGLVSGFSYNRSLRQLNTVATSRNVVSWHVGFTLQRPLGRKAQMHLTYHMTGQDAGNPAGCTGLACGHTPIRHHFALAFSWGFGPYAID
jgi:hypothetical protein